MFDSWFKKPEPKQCSHPKWEIVKEIETPSIVEQMKLETLTPEAKEKILSTLSPCDYNKQTLLVMSCPFCGVVKEFKTATNYTENRVCNHQWDLKEHHKKSSFEETCGEDATFEQRMKVASVLDAYDFISEVQQTRTCKLCGKVETESFTQGNRNGSSERCAHSWSVIADGAVSKACDAWSLQYGDCKQISIEQNVLLSCLVCGETKKESLISKLTITPEKKKK